MSKPNRKCLICKTPYYACSASLNLAQGSWRATFCSPECYQEWLRIQEAKKNPVVEPVAQVELVEQKEVSEQTVDVEGSSEADIADLQFTSEIEPKLESAPTPKRSKKREIIAEEV